MNNYESLLDEACNEGLVVKEKPLKASDGRIKGKRIAIRKDIETTTQKACVLAEELGHHYTSVGNIIDMSDTWNCKQERKARFNGYNRIIGLVKLIEAYEYGCQSQYEIAEYLEVTEEYLKECIHCYESKYGIKVTVGEYTIQFTPYLSVFKKVINCYAPAIT